MKNGETQDVTREKGGAYIGAVFFFFFFLGDFPMNKTMLKGAAFTLAVIALTAFVQRNVMAVPVVGEYLPK